MNDHHTIQPSNRPSDLPTKPNPNATLETLTRADLYQWIYYVDDYNDFTYTAGKYMGQCIRPVASRAGKRLWLAEMGTYAPVARLVWCWFVGRMPASPVTFADGNPDNYAIANLRVADKPYTTYLKRKPRKKRALSGKHVYFYPRTNKWRVSVANQHVGYYDTEELATAAAAQFVKDGPKPIVKDGKEREPLSRLEKSMEKQAARLRAIEARTAEYMAEKREAKRYAQEAKLAKLDCSRLARELDAALEDDGIAAIADKARIAKQTFDDAVARSNAAHEAANKTARGLADLKKEAKAAGMATEKGKAAAQKRMATARAAKAAAAAEVKDKAKRQSNILSAPASASYASYEAIMARRAERAAQEAREAATATPPSGDCEQ